jgi:sugar phosphate isomerase/epimerase
LRPKFIELVLGPTLTLAPLTPRETLIPDFEKFILTLGKRLKVLHIHDNDGIADLHQVPFTFTRTRENNPSTDWEGFIRALRAIAYDGVLNFETAPVLRSFPEGLRPQALHMLAEIGQYFAREISGQ